MRRWRRRRRVRSSGHRADRRVSRPGCCWRSRMKPRSKTWTKYKDIAAQLGDPRKLIEEKARELIKTGKPIYWRRPASIPRRRPSAESDSLQLVAPVFRVAATLLAFVLVYRATGS